MKSLFKIERKPKTVFHEIKANSQWWFNRIVAHKQVMRRTFIVGCGHSGTSLLLSILGSHSKIHIFPFETTLFRARKGKVKSILKHFDNTAISHNKYHWIEKTPKHILFLENIFRFCPDANVVLMIRDGRDVAMSIKARTQNFEEGVKRWVADNSAGQNYWTHPRVLTIRYEDIIEDFKSIVSQTVRFIGEEYESRLERFYEIPKSLFSNKLGDNAPITKPERPDGQNHEKYRNWQVNQKLFDGRGRWKRNMSNQEKALFKKIAGPMLIEYGYEKTDKW
jgi:hypothetical protein